MLVLSRQRDETIVIGDNIEITIVDIRGDKVRLGINAPAHIPVHRKEIYQAMKKRHDEDSAAAGVESLANRNPKPPQDDSNDHPTAES